MYATPYETHLVKKRSKRSSGIERNGAAEADIEGTRVNAGAAVAPGEGLPWICDC